MTGLAPGQHNEMPDWRRGVYLCFVMFHDHVCKLNYYESVFLSDGIEIYFMVPL